MNSETIRGFHASEFVPPEIFNHFGAFDSWWFIRPEIIAINEQLKKDFNAMVVINNWKVGGQYHYSGYRPRACETGGENSQHRLGAASDTKVQGYAADEVRAHILKNKGRYMDLGLTTLEDAHFAPTWVHFDIRPTASSDIFIVKPLH